MIETRSINPFISLFKISIWGRAIQTIDKAQAHLECYSNRAQVYQLIPSRILGKRKLIYIYHQNRSPRGKALTKEKQ